MPDEITITLTGDEFRMLLVMLGHATYVAVEQHDLLSVNDCLAVVNAVNRNNPNFRPYKTETMAGGNDAKRN